MKKILVAGAGRIGSLIASLLVHSQNYEVFLMDLDLTEAKANYFKKTLKYLTLVELDVSRQAEVEEFIRQNSIQAIVSSLPFYCNASLAELASRLQLHYFDLTEDTKTTAAIKKIAQGAKTAFVPQCGLAPGLVGIVTNSLIKEFDQVERVKMRVGALPEHASNALKYALTWSTDGLINEYGNIAEAIINKEVVKVRSLSDLETIELDGNVYEAFNTSGGLGSLVELYAGKIAQMDYKTIRYPGHCEKMRFLMWDLKLNEDRKTLKLILENAIPRSHQDVVVIYVSVTGYKKTVLSELHYVNKIYPEILFDVHWSAIQISTAASLCAVLDIVLSEKEKFQGFIYQEEIPLRDFLNNPFGHYLKKHRSNHE